MSSANIRFDVLVNTHERSLIYRRNNNGLKVEPCGTPVVIVFMVDVAPFSIVLCCLSLRKFLRNTVVLLPNPLLPSLVTSMSWFIVSNAFRKSKKTFLVAPPSSFAKRRPSSKTD